MRIACGGVSEVMATAAGHKEVQDSMRTPRGTVAETFQKHPVPILLLHITMTTISTTANLSSGAGPIGLVTLAAAHAAGCYPIIITDLISSRLEFAKTLVPTVKTLQIQRGWSELETAAAITQLGLEGGLEESEGKVRVALECTGFEPSIRAAIYVSQGENRVQKSRADIVSRWYLAVKYSLLA